MSKEEKEILIKDLCGRLSYGVLVRTSVSIKPLTCEILSKIIDGKNNFIILPFLRPMSSMTEEEKHELSNIRPYFVNSDDIVSGTQCNTFIQASECQDWLNAHHFDFRGLIPMGLALEATEDMYNIKTE